MDKLTFENNYLSIQMKDYFKDNIKLSLKTEAKLFVITKNDLFYEIDIYDEDIQLFLSSVDNSIKEKMIINELCHKRIIDLYYGYSFYIARTVNQEIYCWGNNFFGQLGNEKRDKDPKDYNKPEMNKLLSSLKISEIKCGYHHSLALTQYGEVYAWGGNYYGQIGNTNFDDQLTPKKILFPDEDIVIMISCGIKHSIALTESGIIYSWGITI
jgi:alpha-tubulin suppressor-like RCC1 family protein